MTLDERLQVAAGDARHQVEDLDTPPLRRRPRPVLVLAAGAAVTAVAVLAAAWLLGASLEAPEPAQQEQHEQRSMPDPALFDPCDLLLAAAYEVAGPQRYEYLVGVDSIHSSRAGEGEWAGGTRCALGWAQSYAELYLLWSTSPTTSETAGAVVVGDPLEPYDGLVVGEWEGFEGNEALTVLGAGQPIRGSGGSSVSAMPTNRSDFTVWTADGVDRDYDFYLVAVSLEPYFFIITYADEEGSLAVARSVVSQVFEASQ